jgi:hypothetical protein
MKKSAISRIALFCPVLEDEFHLILKRHDFTKHLTFVEWRYGFEHDIKAISEGATIVKKTHSVWLGNSATITNNHLDYLSLLKQSSYLKTATHVLPLSYGFKNYRDQIVRGFEKNEYIKEPVFMLDFQPFEEYVLKIAECKFMVMMHERQQAMGNIWIGLLSGCEIYLLEGSPTLSFFQNNGFHVYSTNNLPNINLDKNQLFDNLMALENRDKVIEFFSSEMALFRSKNLLESVGALLS